MDLNEQLDIINDMTGSYLGGNVYKLINNKLIYVVNDKQFQLLITGKEAI